MFHDASNIDGILKVPFNMPGDEEENNDPFCDGDVVTDSPSKRTTPLPNPWVDVTNVTFFTKDISTV